MKMNVLNVMGTWIKMSRNFRIKIYGEVIGIVEAIGMEEIMKTGCTDSNKKEEKSNVKSSHRR